MFAAFLSVLLTFGASVAAQSSTSSTPAVVCIAGQCLEGFTNITTGATLSAPGSSTSILLLPGQYQSNTNPALLHNSLTTSSASLKFSPGFSNASTSSSSISLPLNLALEPGIATYADALFAGSPNFVALPTNATNTTTQLAAGSIMMSTNVYASVTSGNNRLIVWDTIADVSQLPQNALGSGMTLTSLQSASCSPPCSSAGTCSAQGTCVCPPGFSGSSCETCATGFFGPTCQACPAGCTDCDDGLSGSGRCLSATVTNAPSTCNCLNGVCGTGESCSCNAGWTASSNGTQCAACQKGFFLSSTGDCQVCALGCTQCADGTGACQACASGFSQSTTDPTQCTPPAQLTPTGTVCPDGSFNNGTGCAQCASPCQTCNGPTSEDCIICGNGKYALNGTSIGTSNCVSVDANGVCAGTNLVADNNKHECAACPAKCTSCGIPGFSVASTINQLQCTGCLPGFVLSNGQCVASCPSGTFLSPTDNLTCTKCDASCGTCAGSATFCLTCTNDQLAFQGSCKTSCPSNTFSSGGSCVSCHPDCATCSGESFSQCSSCPSDRPVLSNGRCLPTCAKNQFFDTTTSACQNCDSSCSSCSGSGPSSCLACASTSNVLKAGTCVAATCASSTSVVPGMGVCFSDLVVTQPSGTASVAPLPSISGLTEPAVINVQGGRRLQWWEILLMVLGCVFIVACVLMLWRRRARKRRANKTAAFAKAKKLDKVGGWRYRLVRFGEKLFGHKASKRVAFERDTEAQKRQIRVQPYDDIEEARAAAERLGGQGPEMVDKYNRYSRAPSSRPSSFATQGHQHTDTMAPLRHQHSVSDSIYSDRTGHTSRTPDVPAKLSHNEPRSRFSFSTMASSMHHTPEDLPAAPSLPAPIPPMPVFMLQSRPGTPAQEYALSVMGTGAARGVGEAGVGQYWLTPVHTGASAASRNPFRQI